MTRSNCDEKMISIHLRFNKKVNLKHKFLDHISPCKLIFFSIILLIYTYASIVLDNNDYLHSINADGFNINIKLLSNNRFIESKKYKPKRPLYVFNGLYRWYQSNVPIGAFIQESLPEGIDKITIFFRKKKQLFKKNYCSLFNIEKPISL